MMIDINTLFIAIITTGIVLAVILTIVGLGVDSSLLYWAGGFGINGIAYLLFALRGAIPDLLSILLANMMIVATYVLFTEGLLRFLNQRLNRLLIWLPVFAIAVIFPFLLHSVETRIVVSGIMITIPFTLLTMLLISNNSQLIGRGKYILMACFVLGIAIAMTRPVAIIFGADEITAFNSPGVLQTMTYVPLVVLHVAMALGLVLMQKEHAEAATDSIARSDDLTGLPNRRRLYERITQFMSQKESLRGFGALMLIDLDNFKALNDQFGHAMGDELLRQAGQRISARTASKDTVARLGGDEFVVLLTELGHDRESALHVAKQTAESIREVLAEAYVLTDMSPLPEEDGLIEHHCSGSIGMILVEPSVKDREALLREADRAMYSAKSLAKGSVSVRQRSTPAQS